MKNQNFKPKHKPSIKLETQAKVNPPELSELSVEELNNIKGGCCNDPNHRVESWVWFQGVRGRES